MSEIIDRISGFDNQAMSDYCESLRRVILQTKEVKSGRGKAIVTNQVLKYNTEQETIDKIIRSCEHYKNLEDVQLPKQQTNIELRDYQKDIINKGSQILSESRFLYLAMEVRTGKTLTSLGIAESCNSQDVLFITKKKAISSIVADFNLLMPSFSLCVINYESLHTIDPDIHWDLVICDEAHSMGAFPKPSARASLVASIIRKYNPLVILLSGTPTPESYSQLYHQVYGIPTNPFSEFKTFYRFCDVYVKVKERKINGLSIRDYSNGLETIIEKMKPFTINYTQSEAGFVAETKEKVLEVEMKESTYKLIQKLKRDLVVQGKDELILGDTPVKLMMKMHQLFSGTIKFESGKSMVIDYSKAQFIYDNFCDHKIGIFYKFKEELLALQEIYKDQLTTELSVFENTDKSIALQIVSGREGISLRKADYLVYYNIDFSATSYWQSKDRMTTKDRLENEVFWIFAKGGIEHDIYKAVTKKRDYTLQHFRNDFYL